MGYRVAGYRGGGRRVAVVAYTGEQHMSAPAADFLMVVCMAGAHTSVPAVDLQAVVYIEGQYTLAPAADLQVAARMAGAHTPSLVRVQRQSWLRPWRRRNFRRILHLLQGLFHN